MRSRGTYNLSTALAAALEASWVSLLHWKVCWLQRQMAGQLKAQQERTFRTEDSATSSQTARGVMDDTGARPHTHSHTLHLQNTDRPDKVKGMKHPVTGPKPKNGPVIEFFLHVGLLNSALLPSGAVVTTSTLLSEDELQWKAGCLTVEEKRGDVLVGGEQSCLTWFIFS